MDSKDVITVVKNLIQTVEAGREGFRLAAEATNNADMKLLFTHYLHQREQFATELRQLAEAFGDIADEPENSVTGNVHRGWINLRTELIANDPAAILIECEREENHAVSEYRRAIELPLPTDVQHAVEAQGLEIKAAHNKLNSLRNMTGMA